MEPLASNKPSFAMIHALRKLAPHSPAILSAFRHKSVVQPEVFSWREERGDHRSVCHLNEPLSFRSTAFGGWGRQVGRGLAEHGDGVSCSHAEYGAGVRPGFTPGRTPTASREAVTLR